MKCAFCKFSAPFIDRAAEYVVDGQAVCEGHVDAASSALGRGFNRVLGEL